MPRPDPSPTGQPTPRSTHRSPLGPINRQTSRSRHRPPTHAARRLHHGRTRRRRTAPRRPTRGSPRRPAHHNHLRPSTSELRSPRRPTSSLPSSPAADQHDADRHIGAMPRARIRAHSGTVQRLVGTVDLARFDSTVRVPTEGSGRTSRHPRPPRSCALVMRRCGRALRRKWCARGPDDGPRLPAR